MTQQIPARLQSIDVLRGLAALAVVCLHAFNPAQWAITSAVWAHAVRSILYYGNLGVPLFFVISGFCIHLRTAKHRAQQKAAGTQDKTQVSFLPFWKRRIYRLYPPYLAALCVAMLLLWLKWRSGSPVDYAPPQQRGMVIDFLLHATMLHGLFPDYDYQGGAVIFWTLAREEYFYLMYFPLLAWASRWGIKRTLILVLVIGIAVPWLGKTILPLLSGGADWWKALYYPINSSSSAIALWIQWCLGMVAVEAYYGLIKLPRWCREATLVPFWAVVAVASSYYLPLLESFLWGMTFFTLINFCVAREVAGRWPQSGILRWLSGVGLFSYSLYLIHIPVLSIFQKMEIILREKVSLPLALVASPLYHFAVWIVLVVLSCVAGKIFFLMVEQWFLNKPETRRWVFVPPKLRIWPLRKHTSAKSDL